ncbi:multidrug effflux MFS transporter [Succinivibrio sp.]|uniref:multidrug effflux MFS transporter n=1 Tax=Succinivibrio sp. TaxID=2053619 RepID=UPI003867F35B
MFKEKFLYAAYVVTLGLLCAFAPMCTDLYLPALPTIKDYFDTSASLVQLSLTASFFGLALGQFLIGPISDVYGRVKPLVVTLLFFVISSFLCSIANSAESFILFRLVQGISAAGGIVLTRSIACDKFKGYKLTSFMSFLMAINSIAPILAPIIGSFIISFGPWQALFYVLTGWGVLLILQTVLFVDESLDKNKRAKSIKDSIVLMKADLFNVRFMLVCIAFAMIMGGFFSYLAASPFVFQSIYGFTPFEYSLTFALVSLCVSAIAPFSGTFAKRFSNINTSRCAIILMIVSGLIAMIIALSPPQSFIPILLVFCVYCSMMGFSMSCGFSIAMEFKKGGAGAASGIFGVMYFVIGSLISPFVGIFGENSMIPLAFNLLFCAILALVFLELSKRLKR